jgi:hypothetical protein
MKLLIENWRKYVNEVEDFDDFATTQDEIQKSLDYFYNCHAPSLGKPKELGDWEGHKMVAFELAEGGILFFAVDNSDRAKAYVAVNPFRESYAIGTVRKAHTEPRFSAAELYMWLAERFGGSLYSDKAQTTGGKSIWAKFPELIEGEPPPSPPYKEKVPTEEDGKGKWRWRLTL